MSPKEDQLSSPSLLLTIYGINYCQTNLYLCVCLSAPLFHFSSFMFLCFLSMPTFHIIMMETSIVYLRNVSNTMNRSIAKNSNASWQMLWNYLSNLILFLIYIKTIHMAYHIIYKNHQYDDLNFFQINCISKCFVTLDQFFLCSYLEIMSLLELSVTPYWTFFVVLIEVAYITYVSLFLHVPCMHLSVVIYYIHKCHETKKFWFFC